MLENANAQYIQGRKVGTAPAGVGNVLTWSGSAWNPAAPASTTNATALQSNPISVTMPTAGQFLAWNGASWIPTTPAAAAGTPQVLEFAKNGSVNVSQLISVPGDGVWSSFPMGHFMASAATLKTLTFFCGSGVAAAAGTATIQLRYSAPNAANLHTMGAGTLLASVDLVAAGASGALYYRTAQTTGLSVAVPAGVMLFCDLSAIGFWSFTDVKVEAELTIP